MAEFLKKLQTENFRLRFLKFSEIDSFDKLEKFTRIKSFILKGQFELSCKKWFLMYRSVVELLQEVRPLDLSFLLHVEPFYGRSKPYLDYDRDGYFHTDFGLYAREQGSVNNVIFHIKCLLRLYGFSLDDAYLVVELTPESASYYSEDVIKSIKNNLYDYLKRTYIHADEYYELAIRAIDELNHSLQHFSTTSYNNLYLLDGFDFNKYSTQAVDTQLDRETNTFTRQELIKAINWLRISRFYKGDYLNLELIDSDECLIVDEDTTIPVTFKTHFMEDRLNG